MLVAATATAAAVAFKFGAAAAPRRAVDMTVLKGGGAADLSANAIIAEIVSGVDALCLALGNGAPGAARAAADAT